MLAVLRNGKPRRGDDERSTAFRALRDLRWRQRFAGKEEYVVELRTASPVTLAQETRWRERIQGTGTGATVWPAAHALARYLERRGDLRGKRVLELGAGTGAAGLCAARLGAARVALTDVGRVLELARSNAHRNGFEEDTVRVFELDWARPRLDEGYDLVLASECVLPQLYPLEPLADVLAAVTTREALVAYEHRAFPAFDPRLRFPALLAARGLATRVVPPEELDADFRADDLVVWQVSPRTASPLPATKTLVCEAPWTPTRACVRLPGCRVELEVAPSAGVGSLWPSSVAAARLLLANHTGRRVLDLGAGCGLVAIALACASACDVLATDVSCDVLHRNVAAATPHFKKGGTVTVRSHAWGDPLDTKFSCVDLVVCSDCVYDSATVAPLLATLAALPGDFALLVVNEHRTAFDAFLQALRPRFPRLANLFLPEAAGTIDCLPPERQPPPLAAFYCGTPDSPPFRWRGS